MTTQGGESNLSGQFLEDTIEREFRVRGVPVFDWETNGDNGDLLSQQFLLRRVPYTSIYGCRSRSEFVYRHFRRERDIRIECRWQQTPGSVDEKFPYLLRNAKEKMPESEVWFVIDGLGARSAALDWLKREATRDTHKSIKIMNLVECRFAVKSLLAAMSEAAA